mmetsp:Transcript_31981/g.56152  ORF Transcript_31981/g.56152 Transcript_31981/m.56152 type:complete len:217 (-) Transcript_31981:84-734(-)
MPKSKRAKLVHLTKTKKKGKAKGDAFIDEVRDLVDEFSNIFLFKTENMRNSALKELRSTFASSRFLIGRNKLMMVALGVDEESEYRSGVSGLAQKISGECGLLFTNMETKEVKKYFDDFKVSQFARAGNTATRKMTIPPGELPGLPVSMEPQLRRLGLPVRIKKGKLELAAETTVCEAGDSLSGEQCKVLEMFQEKMVSFRIHIVGCYSDEKFTQI